MVLDINGIYYHLHVSHPVCDDGIEITIVDEAFRLGARKKRVNRLSEVPAMIDDYAGAEGALHSNSCVLEALDALRDMLPEFDDNETARCGVIARSHIQQRAQSI